MIKKLPKKIVYNPFLGKIVARGARRSRVGRFHIISSVSDAGKWSLVLEGSTRPIKVFSTKNAAVSFAKKYEARSARYLGEVIIHSKDGQTENKILF
jgi:hypothetical protein